MPGRAFHCILIARLTEGKVMNPVLHLQVNLFCQDVVDGVDQWLTEISGDSVKQSRLQRFLEIGPFAKILT